MKRSIFLTLLAPVVLAGSLHGASDYLLEIDGIKGESQDSRYPESIHVDSFHWGVNNSAAGGGGGAGKVSFSDLHFSTAVSKASPQLMLACATGQPIRKAVLHVRKAGDNMQEYYTMTMTDLLVSSLRQVGDPFAVATGGDTVPTEEIVLYFNEITIEHTADDGTVTTATVVRTPEL